MKTLPNLALAISSVLCVFQARVFGEVTLTNVVSFSGGNNGNAPYCRLVEGRDGNFYGTTLGGGPSNGGIIFRMTPSGDLTPLVPLGINYGSGPLSGLVQGANGNFYGTTVSGGIYDRGTVFQMTPDGTLTVLGSMNGTNGANPQSPLIQADDGAFYGTAAWGGIGYDGSAFSGNGTAFRVTTNGILTVLVSFDGTNGSTPRAALVQGTDGNFYGTLEEGGPNGSVGTVFRLTPFGTVTNLVAFKGTNGLQPEAELLQAKDGNFYGTTLSGGSMYDVSGQPQNFGNGTIFKMTTNGTLTTLVSFTGTSGACLGRSPYAGLIQGTDGGLYGTTYHGGTYGYGTVFRVTTIGAFSTLYSFRNGNDGRSLAAGVLQCTDGNFYGVALGGALNCGTVFRFSMQPMFQTVTHSQPWINFAWNAAVGLRYQVQHSTNLTSPNWNNLGNSFVAPTDVISLSDVIGSTPQEFYRVVWLP